MNSGDAALVGTLLRIEAQQEGQARQMSALIDAVSTGLRVPDFPPLPPPDLSGLVEQLESVARRVQPLSADALREALTNLTVGPPAQMDAGLTEALQAIAAKLAVSPRVVSGGSGGNVKIRTADGAVVTESNPLPVAVTDLPGTLRFDYEARGDTQPVYLGKAEPGSAAADPVWTVTKFAYESSTDDARITMTDMRVSVAWDNRTDPTVDGQPAWAF